MVRILIVEDELIISRDMTSMLTKMGYDVIGDAIDFEEAITILEKEIPDLILLDINLNGKRDGVDLAHEINLRFQVPFIFTTSYSDTATLERAQHTNPVNYLVKPFKQEQLFTAVEMGLYKAAAVEKPIAGDVSEEPPIIIKGMLFIKDKLAYSKLVIADIRWIKSDGNYLEIYTSVSKPVLLRASMGSILERLDHNFLRCHKSYIINLVHLTKFDTQNLTIGDEQVPISKNYREELLTRLNIF